MLLSRNSIAMLIESLEFNGYVTRSRSNKDHRTIIIDVISKGIEFIMSHLKRLIPLEKELRDCLDDELSLLVALTRKL
jgi:DNA-binding MarR family transcriptional regulator